MRNTYFIFDLDGTLFDTSLDLARSVNFALDAFGLPTHSVETVVSFIGNGSMNLIRRSLGGAQEHILQDIHQRFLAHYLEHCTIDTRPYPGVMEFLSKPCRASILTNKPHAPTQTILKHFGLGTRFENVLCGDTAPARKPDPAGLQAILTIAGISAEQAIMIGDDLPDIGVASAAGVRSLALLNGFGKPDELRKANPTYTSPDFQHFARLMAP